MTAPFQPRFSRIALHDMSLHVAEAGPADGPLLILLHGFPEFWYGWRRQIGALAAAGYHVAVPDQRGYNLSDKPKALMDYRLSLLAGDVLELAGHFGAERFFLAGHDWGAIAGWWTAQNHPDRVSRFVALSAGHPAVWRERMETDAEQRRKSRYVKMFAVPWLPELAMRARNFKALADALTATAVPGTVTDSDLARYREAWSRPGALTGGLNWYRAILKTPLQTAGAYRVRVPVLMIWGMKDIYGDRRLAEESVALCDNGRLVVLDEATHWILTDAPERTSRLMIDFFG